MTLLRVFGCLIFGTGTTEVFHSCGTLTSFRLKHVRSLELIKYLDTLKYSMRVSFDALQFIIVCVCISIKSVDYNCFNCIKVVHISFAIA